ncbi:MAG: DUF3883 domain-containing protein, partial [Acholeplasma sp.]|nr:DUF3883 domain-containing protein [Acholeplasma sp.]
FELTSERNNLIKDNENNKAIIDSLIEFIIEKGIEIARLTDKCDYEALEFLLPANDLYMLDKEYSFSSKLKSKIKKYEVFPSINDYYISLNDNTKYTDNNWHRLLNKKTFSNLLKVCDDEKIKKYIKDNLIGFYSDSEFVNLINNDADEYVSNRVIAKIIALYHEQYRYSKIAPNILIDREGNRILDDSYKVFNNPEFLFDLPEWSQLRFINKSLETELRTIWGNCSIRTLVDYLSNYGCDEYSFDKVIKELVSQCKEDSEKTKSLIKWLFVTWKNNNQQFASSLSNVDVKTIDRNGDIIGCSKCYFGKEYDNLVGERIINNIDNPIYLACLPDLDLNGETAALVKPFFKQLGVKEYPIIESIELDIDERKEYIVYNSKYYPTLYSDRKEALTHEELFYYQQLIKVDKIRDIEKILSNSDFEDILYWILNDKDLYDCITSSNEKSDNSLMRGYPYRKLDYRYVKKEQMKSWLHRVFLEYVWLPTMSGRKVNSYNCTIASHKLSPIIEVLLVDYEKMNSMLQRNCKKEIDVLFEKIGIADDIVDLPKEKIYDILHRLPEIDNDFTLGKKIYTQLNLFYKDDKINKLITDNKKYEEFKKNGKVLAETNKKYSYVPLNQVYYVGKKVYSDDVLDHYPKLALNRRIGDSKVEKIFCVQSILKIGNVKVDNIVEHELNAEYQRDFQKLLPYIYAKRLEFDQKNKELNILKKSNIFLASDATTKYTIGDVVKQGQLKDYELIYSLSEKIAYIKIPSAIATIDSLKNEMAFISSVAEVITTMIDVDGDKDSFTIILRSHSIKEVEDYFKSNGDETLSIVNLSKEKFDSMIDLKDEFINALVQTTQQDESIIINLVAEILGVSFDYQILNSTNNYDLLKKLFNNLSIDAQDYNKYAYENINLNGYYKDKFLSIKQKYRNKYMSYIANRIINDNGTFEEFESEKKAYDFLDLSCDNSFNFDVIDKFEKALSITISELEKFEDDFVSISKQIVRYKEKNAAKNDDSTDKKSSKEIVINYKELNEQIKNETTNKSSSPELESLKTSDNHHAKGSNNGGSYNNHQNEVNELHGFIAESKVYHTLLAKNGEIGSVEWISGNAQKAGIRNDGNDSLGYDIMYSDHKGIHYVEVKGSKSNIIEFKLTKNEFDFAERNKNQYELWFVPIDEQKKPGEPLELGNILLFSNGETFFKNSRFNVEQSEFKIRA